jgi:hypothetical protein
LHPAYLLNGHWLLRMLQMTFCPYKWQKYNWLLLWSNILTIILSWLVRLPTPWKNESTFNSSALFRLSKTKFVVDLSTTTTTQSDESWWSLSCLNVHKLIILFTSGLLGEEKKTSCDKNDSCRLMKLAAIAGFAHDHDMACFFL